MANGKILRQLLKAGISGDNAAFRRASETIIGEERQKQHHLLANDLEKILYGDNSVTLNTNLSFLLRNIPTDGEKGLPLIDLKQPTKNIEEIILPDESMVAIEEILEEHRRQDILNSYGMRASNKLMLYGPPGCGKTLTAEIIAQELEYPLATIRLDSLVSSFLGQTATNLRKIFDFISQYQLVALFDEFDAIGKERGDSGEHGELRRVVNAVLQMLDAYNGKSIILAATNHEKILDSAIWRRFDDTVNIPYPSNNLISKILTLKLRGVRRQFDVDDKNLVKCFHNLSGADIERIIRRAIKRMILKNQEFLSIKDIKLSIERENKK